MVDNVEVVTASGWMEPSCPDPRLVAVVGDWHSNQAWAVMMLRELSNAGVQVVVHAGDFGFWSDPPTTAKYLASMQEALRERGMWLFWVDGNHEDHSRLDALPIDPVTGLRPIPGFDRIVHLPRGYRWAWHGRVWMSLGGAHSVDRANLLPMVSWWPRETISYAEAEYAAREDDERAPGLVDVMVCHDAPAAADIPALRGQSPWPVADLISSARHRELLGAVVDAVKPSVLYHGHYHRRYSTGIVRADGGTTLVHGLSENGTWPQGNAIVLDLDHGVLPQPAT